MSLDQIDAFPPLQHMLQVWRDLCVDGLPRSVDPTTIPPSLLPHVMLLDVETAHERLRVRLAGTAICQKHGGELRGLTTDQMFRAEDAAGVYAAAHEIVLAREPALAGREYFSAKDQLWSYVRLVLPYASNGHDVDLLMNVTDPASLREYRSEA